MVGEDIVLEYVSNEVVGLDVIACRGPSMISNVAVSSFLFLGVTRRNKAYNNSSEQIMTWAVREKLSDIVSMIGSSKR